MKLIADQIQILSLMLQAAIPSNPPTPHIGKVVLDFKE